MIGYLPRLRRFALTLTGHEADADDLVQSTYLKAIENLEKWELGTRLDSWLYRIAQNLWLNTVRHQKVKTAYAEDKSHFQDTVVDGEDAVVQKSELKQVEKSVEALPPDQKVVLLLVAVEGYGYQEAAEILEIPIGTLTSRLARARQSLLEKR
nr:RNA polymerase sigma factor [Sneathiella limimaris]